MYFSAAILATIAVKQEVVPSLGEAYVLDRMPARELRDCL
jgi:hypothetical protein